MTSELITKSIDTVISIYEYNVQPTRSELFTSGDGFIWDKNYWINPGKQNNNLYIPSLWDPTTANIPTNYWQSGYSFADALLLEDIERLRVNGNEKWYAKLRHGTYFVKNVPYYLYGEESVLLQLKDGQTEDGRSLQPLLYSPKQGIPISVSTQTVDPDTGLTVDAVRFKKVGKFTGRIQNGVELDTEVVTNIDSTKKEFIVNYNANNKIENWRIPTGLELKQKALATIGNITFTTKNDTSNFNGYSIEYVSDVVAGNEWIETIDSQIKIHIQNSLSKTEDVANAFNEVYGSSPKAEELKITFVDGSSLDGKYFYINSVANNYYVWFNTGSSFDPSISGKVGLEINIQPTMNAIQIASSVQVKLEETLEFTVISNNEILIIANTHKGVVNDSFDVNSGVTIEMLTQGSEDSLVAVNNSPAAQEITDVECISGLTLGGTYFRIYSASNSYYVWYNTGLSTDPDPDTGGSVGVEVPISTGNDASIVALATRNAVRNLADFAALAQGETTTIITEEVGVVSASVDGNTGMQITTTQSGANHTYEYVEPAKTLYAIYSFYLPELPLSEFAVDFSRKDIFDVKKFTAENYGGGIYNTFFYGEGIDKNNDYSVNYSTGEVMAILDQDYVDLGYVTYTFDYPAEIEFNNNYLIDNGHQITSPTVDDIPTLDLLGNSTGEKDQVFILGEFPVLDYSTENFLDTDNFKIFLYDVSLGTFDTTWYRVRSLKDYGESDNVYELNSDTGTVSFGDGVNGAIPLKYVRIYAGYKQSLKIEYEPVDSTDYWYGKNTDLNLNKNDLNSGFLFLSRKELIPFQVDLQFSTNSITALEFADLVAVVTDADGEIIPGIQVHFELLNASNDSLPSSIGVTNSIGETSVTYLPSGSLDDLGSFIQLFEEGADEDTLGNPLTDKYFSSSVLLPNNMIVADETIHDDPTNIYIFKVYDNNDGFLEYNNKERTGGMHQVLYKYDAATSQNILLRPSAISGKVLIFDESLPQPFDMSAPNYDPDLRGFIIIGKKRIQAKAKVYVGDDTIESEVANLQVEYSLIQKGEWTLPVLPTSFNGSEINRASYIMLNPATNEMLFTQSGDTDTIVLEHNTVLGYTISVTVNDREYTEWSFNPSANPNTITWNYNAIKSGDNVRVTYAYESL